MRNKREHLHEKRGVTFQELGALLGARNMLAARLLDHDGTTELDGEDKHLFNMQRACKVEGCGTVSCIGGTMALIMGYDKWQAVHYVGQADGQRRMRLQDAPVEPFRSAPLHDLFFPPAGYDWTTIKPAQAVKAIDNWLNCGTPGWKLLLKDNQRES